MKKLLYVAIVIGLLASCSNQKGLLPAPLDVKFGDPYVLLASDGHYYMYGTGGVEDGFGCYKSDDLKNREYQGTVYQGNTPESWAMANFFGGENYAVGYATSNSPLGPFVKSDDNPVLEKDTPRGGVVTGVGHNSITWSRDGRQLYCVYHGRTAATGHDRVVFISPMEIKNV